MNILLVGCGKMGSAMLSRWKDLNLYDQICVIEPSTIGSLAVQGVKDVPENFKPGVVVFAVKPQTLPDIIEGYRGFSALFLSIAAGMPISFFEKHLGADAKIVRSMPNTPAAIGKGVTVACANMNVSKKEKENAAALLSAVGEVLWVNDENLLNPVTALSGSGPAYVFLLMEILEKAGTHIGLDPAMAKKLARQTVIGSAALAEASPEISPEQLRKNVTSPGGTTQAALDVLLPSAVQDIFNAALKAATKRAEELAR
jgi:pyrroline-5-carboxylate reductase